MMLLVEENVFVYEYVDKALLLFYQLFKAPKFIAKII